MKTLSLTIIAGLCSLSCFAQITPPKGTAIELTYDPTADTLKAPSGYGLLKGQYYLKISPLNDAYYTTKATTQFLNKVSTPPSVLGGLAAPTTTTSHADLLLLKHHFVINTDAHPLGADRAENTIITEVNALIKDIGADYDFLTDLYDDGNSLKSTLAKDPTQIGPLTTLANADFGDLKRKVAIMAGPVATKPSDLKPFSGSVINDLLAKCSLIMNNHDYAKEASPDQLTAIYKAQQFINDPVAKTFIQSCPDIINAVVNAQPYIVTTSNNFQRGDYMVMNVSILENRLDKPDTLLTQKLVFYRKHYVKAIDISSGFFYDNLFQRSFYYSNTTGMVTEEKRGRSDFAIGALVHVYYVASSDFKLGLCAGAGVSALDTKTKYFGGGSLIFGSRKEFCLSGGAALASLSIPSHVAAASPSTGAVPLYSSITWGCFAGFTYTFVQL